MSFNAGDSLVNNITAQRARVIHSYTSYDMLMQISIGPDA